MELQRLRVTRQGECRDWGQVRAVIMDCTHILVSCHVMKIDWDFLAFEYLIGFYVNINHVFLRLKLAECCDI